MQLSYYCDIILSEKIYGGIRYGIIENRKSMQGLRKRRE